MLFVYTSNYLLRFPSFLTEGLVADFAVDVDQNRIKEKREREDLA